MGRSLVAKIDDILRRERTLSFEFFPPRTPEAEAQLERTLEELEPLHPSYVSVTYGAGAAPGSAPTSSWSRSTATRR